MAVSEINKAFQNLITMSKKKVEIKKLWQNASPASAFNNQTISLDLSQYDFVMIWFNLDTNQRGGYVAMAETNRACYVAISNTTRHYRVNTNGIVFTNLSKNTEAIPYRIYGVKGVI